MSEPSPPPLLPSALDILILCSSGMSCSVVWQEGGCSTSTSNLHPRPFYAQAMVPPRGQRKALNRIAPSNLSSCLTMALPKGRWRKSTLPPRSPSSSRILLQGLHPQTASSRREISRRTIQGINDSTSSSSATCVRSATGSNSYLVSNLYSHLAELSSCSISKPATTRYAPARRRHSGTVNQNAKSASTSRL